MRVDVALAPAEGISAPLGIVASCAQVDILESVPRFARMHSFAAEIVA